MRNLKARCPFDSLTFYLDLTLDPEDFFFNFGVGVGVGVGVGSDHWGTRSQP